MDGNRHEQLGAVEVVVVIVTITFAVLPALAADAGTTVNIFGHGVGDGKTLCTAAIQQAVEACAAAGGGTVRVPKGTFLTGSIRLASRVTILLDEGATLLGSPRVEAALVVCP